VQGIAKRTREGVNARGESGGRTHYSLDENLGDQLQDWLDGGGKKYGNYNGSYFELGTTPDFSSSMGQNPFQSLCMATALPRLQV